MSIKTNYFDGGGISYAAADLIAPFASLLSDGVFSGQNALAHGVANLSVDVQIGNAIKSGYFIKSDAIVNVAIGANTSGYNRIDLIVLNIDTTGKVSTFAAVQGTPSSSPVAPTAGALQLALAQVLVGNNASAINQNVITDVRMFCGVPNQSGWVPLLDTYTYASADSPTFTVTVTGDLTAIFKAGVKIKLTQTTYKYFIVSKDSTYSAPNTTITLYGGTDFTLANAAISSVFYSLAKAPFGFPLDPAKWSVLVADSNDYTQNSPADSTFYNIGAVKITLPIGSWNTSVRATVQSQIPFNALGIGAGLSTSTSSLSDNELYTWSDTYANGATGTKATLAGVLMQKSITVVTKTDYFLIEKAIAEGSSSFNWLMVKGSMTQTVLRAVCAYL